MTRTKPLWDSSRTPQDAGQDLPPDQAPGDQAESGAHLDKAQAEEPSTMNRVQATKPQSIETARTSSHGPRPAAQRNPLTEETAMARYYFYTADMFYEDKETPGAEVRRVGDYQGVYTVEDDRMAPDAIFANLMEELKITIPAEARDSAYYHITQFNNVT